MIYDLRFKIAFIGSHGVGKTTLCYGLAARLKARDVAVEVVHEVARRCPLPINEETSVAAQSWILHSQIAEELVAQARYPVVVCDRSVLDNYVYLLLAAGRQEGPEGLVDALAPRLRPAGPRAHRRAAQPGRRALRRPRLPARRRGAPRRELDERGLAALHLDPAARPAGSTRWSATVWERLRPAQLLLPAL